MPPTPTPKSPAVERSQSAASTRRFSTSPTKPRASVRHFSASPSKLRASSASLARPATSSLRESRMNAIRSMSGQPMFKPDNSGSPPSGQDPRGLTHDSSKENVAPPDTEEYETQRRAIETLKAEINALRYESDNVKNNAEIQRIQQENETRRAKELADEEFKKKQAAESEHHASLRQLERLQQEIDKLREKQDSEKQEIEKRARAAEEQARLFQEQIEDMLTAKDEAARFEEKKVADLNTQIQKDANRIRELEENVLSKDNSLEEARKRLEEKDNQISEAEAEMLRFKAQSGDVETMAIIRRELSEQVSHIRGLETTNREQLAELQRLRQNHKAVVIVEEEKASLQRKLEDAQSLKTELAAERRLRTRRDAERLAWAAYLEREGQEEFDTPEAVARALVKERFNAASLLEKVGSIQAQIAERDAIIQAVADEKSNLESQVEKLKAVGETGLPDRIRQRLERQRTLAEKESKLLREQLQMYESEDLSFQPDRFDEEKAHRIKKLEELVEEYKTEIQNLETQIRSSESSTNSPAAVAGTKRPAPDDSEPAQHDQIGQLTRKNRTLQDDMDTLKTQFKLMEKELSVAREQLAASERSSSTRILELRNNPTAKHEAVKQATINELRTENQQLRAIILNGESGTSAFQSVPVSTLISLQRDLANAKGETHSAKKQCQRLKEVWKDKSDEFKEAVFALLGWHVTFIPSNKMRVESVYYASESDEHERSITFDGDRGSMKFGGGPRSEFALKLSDLTKYWVREKNCIPGFLAALTLEFYEQAVQEGRVPQ
ncbi:putative spindle assembly checkpoint protein [Coniella lustricola]|uniref:Spindle assembly checkpoint component MAD1 n=1 Tax=Coniella lustricola TaxID=2025994 RepID=A0A2T3A1C6_9PEZI|nr:putative spindle assembly checkpoint protein [Coniella lustricola]